MPDTMTRGDTAADLRVYAHRNRDAFTAWARDTSRPDWGTWVAGDEPTYAGWGLGETFRRAAEEFYRYLDTHPELFPETAVPQGNTAPLIDLDTLTARTMTREQFVLLHDAYFTWQTGDIGGTQNTAQENYDALLRDDSFTRYVDHKDVFLNWLRNNRQHLPVPAPQVAPIGPATPGWDAWWERLQEYAVDEGYEEQFNDLARAFNVPEIDTTDEDDEERDWSVEVNVNLRVRVNVSGVSRNDVNNNGISEYIEESDVDDAIREYIRNSSVDWDIEDYEED